MPKCMGSPCRRPGIQSAHRRKSCRICTALLCPEASLEAPTRQSSPLTDSWPDSCSPCKRQPWSVVVTTLLSSIGLFLGVRSGYARHPHFEERKPSVNRSLPTHAVSKGGSPSLKHHASIQCSSAIFCPWSPPPRLS